MGERQGELLRTAHLALCRASPRHLRGRILAVIAMRTDHKTPALDWRHVFREKLREGRVEDAQRAALLALFAADWARVRAVARRRLDHDACFAVAECALRKVGSYAHKTIAETGAPPDVENPWGLLRFYVRRCVLNLRGSDSPQDDFDADALPAEAAAESDPDLRAAVALCLDRLDAAHLAVLAAHLDGLDDLDAAITFQLSPAGVRTRRRRARLALRECLEAQGITVGGDDD